MKSLFPSLSWLLASKHPGVVERSLPRGVRLANTVLNTAVWLILTWAAAAWIYNFLIE